MASTGARRRTPNIRRTGARRVSLSFDGEIRATKIEIQWLKQQIRRVKKDQRLRVEMQLQRAEGRLDALRAAR